MTRERFRDTAATYGQVALTKLGRISSKRPVHWLNAAANYIEVGRWFHERGLRPAYVHRDRFELFRRLAEQISGRHLLYLEFGVWLGRSLRRWTLLHDEPRSEFHGFDTFEGLPGEWNAFAGKGAYSAHSRLPDIGDRRVRFFKGLFQDTLSDYVAPEHEVLVVNLDADLYDSTLTALRGVAPLIRPGTFLYFDEFSDRLNEMRAFREFIEEHDITFRAVAATPNLTQVVFEVTSFDGRSPALQHS